MKRIVLCADDYGQAPLISQAIVQLAERRHLSAVSCLVTSAYWPEHAIWLRPYRGILDVGLHFNLTEGILLATGAQANSLSTLVAKAFLHQLDPVEIARECLMQLERFVQHFGRLPDYIDGHHHVHQLPIVREAVVKVFTECLRRENAYILLVNVRRNQFKKWLIFALGTRAMEKLLQKEGIPFNPSFAGVYDFKTKRPYRDLFLEFIRDSADRGVIMCHPGLPGKGDHDLINEARCSEYDYLEGEVFVADCVAQRIEVGRFQRF